MMIKAAEERIGNLLIDYTGKIFKINSSYFSGTGYSPKPIILTPEILESLADQIIVLKSILLIVQNKPSNTWWFGLKIDSLTTQIKTVHHLQNVFYDLTCTELNVDCLYKDSDSHLYFGGGGFPRWIS